MMQRARFGSVVIGAPGAFTVWIFEVVRALAAQDPTRTVRYLDRTDDIVDSSTSRPIYLTQFPGDAVIEAIESGEFEIIVALEDPVDGVAFLRRTAGVSLLDAIRAQTASGVAHIAIGRAPWASLLYRSTDRSARDVALQVARCLSLPAHNAVVDDLTGGPSDRPGVSLEAALEARVNGYAKPLRNGAGSTDESIPLIVSVLDPLLAMARGDTVRPIVWPTEVFLSGDRPNEPAPRIAALTGPARVLYYGPYFHLPPANYRVEVILAFSRHTESIPFTLEMHGASLLARVRIERRTEGAYRGYFRLNHRTPVDALEIRLRNEQGAIEGEIALVEVRFFAT